MPAHERARAYEAFVEALARRTPPVRLRAKTDVAHQRWAHRALELLTFGGQDRYLREYVTTLGHTLYLPTDWDARDPGDKLAVLRHEVVHVEQFERHGWLVMTLVYGLLPLPVGLAYGRAMLELEAYRETIVATAEIHGLEAACSTRLRDFVVDRFVGPDYLFMWPFRRSMERRIEAIQREVARRCGAEPSLASPR